MGRLIAESRIRRVQSSILRAQAIGTARQMSTIPRSRNLYSACKINHATISISTTLDSTCFTRVPWDAKCRSLPSVRPARPHKLQSSIAVPLSVRSCEVSPVWVAQAISAVWGLRRQAVIFVYEEACAVCMGQKRRANANEDEDRTRDRFSSTLAICASIIAAVR